MYPRKKGYDSEKSERKVQTGRIPGMECKLRLVIASFLKLFPHIV